jgi:hypothetical protein
MGLYVASVSVSQTSTCTFSLLQTVAIFYVQSVMSNKNKLENHTTLSEQSQNLIEKSLEIKRQLDTGDTLNDLGSPRRVHPPPTESLLVM